MLPIYRTFMARHGTDIANTVIVLCLRNILAISKENDEKSVSGDSLQIITGFI